MIKNEIKVCVCGGGVSFWLLVNVSSSICSMKEEAQGKNGV